MKMGLITTARLSDDQEFVLKIRSTIVDAAIAVQAEDPATKNHTERSRLAYQVLHSPDQYAKLMAYGVASVSTDKSTDKTLSDRVAAIWDAYALGGG